MFLDWGFPISANWHFVLCCGRCAVNCTMLPGKDRTATPKYALGIKIILRNSRHGRNDENRVDYLFNNGKVSPSLGFSDGSDGKESTCNAGDLGSIPQGWDNSSEEGMATHSSILAWRIPKDRGVWRATVHGVTKSQTWLSIYSMSPSLQERNVTRSQETLTNRKGTGLHLTNLTLIHPSFLVTLTQLASPTPLSLFFFAEDKI